MSSADAQAAGTAPAAGAAPCERFSRAALLALIAAFPLGWLARAALGTTPDAPAAVPPSHVNVVVITASELAPVDWARAPERLADLARRGSVLTRVFAPSSSAAGSAASLWTGRWAVAHGVLADATALSEGAWTLAEAARRSGAATAAFLEEPFASRNRIGGFDLTLELPGAGPQGLASAAAAFLDGQADRRTLVWIHFARADAAALEGLLRGLEPAASSATADSRRYDTLTLIAGFAGARNEGGAVDPRTWLAAGMPGALNAGSVSAAVRSLVDVAGFLRLFLRIPGPDPAAGEAEPQSRAEAMWDALRGRGQSEPCFVHGAGREVCLLPMGPGPGAQLARVTLPLRELPSAEGAEVLVPGPGGMARAEGEQLEQLLARHLELARSARGLASD